MKKRSRSKKVIVVILLLLLALMAYIYFIMLKSGGGIVSASKVKVGGIEFQLGIYGPGRGPNPTFRRPMATVVDNEKNIYITDSENNRVCVFDSDGNFLFEFGGRGVAVPLPGEKGNWKPGLFNFPYGITFDPDAERIYVADMGNERIQVFDTKGKFVDWFPKEPVKMNVKFHATKVVPTAIAYRNGKIYVCSSFQVVVFDKNGKKLQTFGLPGDGKGQLDRPNGIDAGPDGTIYVADSNNLRLQAFTPEGKVKWVLGKRIANPLEPKKTPDRKFGLPRNLSVGPDGIIYMADAFDSQIKIISPEGKIIGSMGKYGTEDGKFNMPNAVYVDKDKLVYVTDRENHRVQVVKITGFKFENP